ncbi:unnamed protein product [Calypogeia fissa]
MDSMAKAQRRGSPRGTDHAKRPFFTLGDDYPEVGMRPTSRSMVQPAQPTEKHWLALSNLDRLVNPTYSSVILFYSNVLDSTQFQDVTRSLKDSLAKVLVHFYPLAGRLALREDGQVDIHCNDEGAVFIEASVDAELSAVGGARPMPSLSGLEIAGLGKGPRYIPDQISSIPTLVVQVTRFRCGSIAVAANWHHTVADGSSGCQFMKSWAEIGAGLELSVQPNHDRFLLNPREIPDTSLVNGYSTGELDKMLSNSELSRYEKLLSEPAVLESFQVKKVSVQEIKEKMSLDNDEGGYFTTAESVSAHLWRQMTKARAEPQEEGGDDMEPRSSNRGSDSLTRFFMFVDGRKKLNMPKGYFGNVVCSACAVASEEEILTKPLANTASLIRKATRSISGDYFRSLIDWVEVQGHAPAKTKSQHILSVGQDCAATFWTFFPLYEMNFGWGRPSLAARNSPPRPLIDGIAVMPSSEGPDSMVALLNLHVERMNRLRKQASFNGIYVPTSDQPAVC